jgi:hypothetical protein
MWDPDQDKMNADPQPWYPEHKSAVHDPKSNRLNKLLLGDIPRHERSKIDHIFLVAVAEHSEMKNKWSEVSFLIKI